MSKHAKPETPLERADRLIWELRELRGTPRVMETAYRITEDHIPCAECQDKILAHNLEAFRWEIENPLFGKALQ